MTEQSKPAAAERKEYTLTAPLIQRGEEKKKGDKVRLRPDQAERLKDILA